MDEQKSPVSQAPVVTEQTVGIDLGLTHFLIDSNGNKADNPRFLKASLAKLAKEQKIFARKKKGSNNRQKHKLKVARVHEKVANQRLDFLHKLTAKLVYKALAVNDVRSATDKDSTRYHATSFAVEDLNAKGALSRKRGTSCTNQDSTAMMKNRKLSRSIADVSWSKFKELLSYKCAWTGKNLLEIGRFEASSKVCSQCNHKLEQLDLSVRRWECPVCHADHDRDINAAVNIKRIALVEALGHSVCVKRSPETVPVSAGVSAKGGNCRGSQEAPTIATLGV